ncbi:hypothetical protein FSP39_020832 [Pinctada imbricata]|uniref:PID domain-containing protein n=1 Tax=Pinctada imbricata TaxID=66713 RepID=A0AA88XDP2_PINIB|nr:hypothetical protein FSP39_020832 [Pinctada imbricata]
MLCFFRKRHHLDDVKLGPRFRKRRNRKLRYPVQQGIGDTIIVPTMILDYRGPSETDITVTSLPRVGPHTYVTMEGDFVLGYLGNTIIAKATASGLGTIQKPLRDAYFEYRKTSGKKSKKKDLTEVGLRVSPQGIYILVAGSHPGSNESFYDMQSVSFFEAVTFKTVKGTDKKLQAGFLPIDINRSPNTGSEKLFTPLDKKYQTFAKMDHPAILALVMRRTTGVRALECHAFVCEDDRQALSIVNMIGTLQERGGDPRVMDYQRPYDPYGGPPRRPDNFHGEFRDSDPGFPRGQRPPPDRWDPPDSDSRQMGSDPRGMLGASRNDRLIPPQHYDDGGRRLGGENRYPTDEVVYRHERQRSNEYGRGEEYGDRRSGDFRHERQRSGDFRHERQGSGDFRHERQRSGDYARDVDPRYGDEEVRYRHERQRSNELRASEHYGDRRSGDYAGDRRSGGMLHERQRSGEITPRDELRSSRDMHEFGRQGRPETRPEGQMRIPRPMSPVRPGPATAPKPSRALSPGPYKGGEYQQRQPLRSPRDERGPPTPSGPEYSLSSLESRQEMENRPNKPVARVPPHLVAGVKVLPTGFRASIQQKAGQKPPKSPVDERRAIAPEEGEENPYDNAISRREFYKKEGRNALSESERYFDEPGKESRYVYHPPNPPDVLPVEERERQRDMNNPDLNDYDRVIRRDNNFNDPHGQNANYRYSAPPIDRGRDAKPWSYDEQFQKFSREKDSDDLKRPNYSDGEFKFYDSSGGSDGRKAYEVKDQFSKMNIQNQKGGLNTAGTNFEESLGYFP